MKTIERLFADNQWADWGIALGIAAAVLAGMMLAQYVAETRLRKLAKTTESMVDDMLVDLLAGTRVLLLLPVALVAGASSLTLPGRVFDGLQSLAIITVLLQSALWGNRLIAYWLSKELRRRLAADAAAATTVTVLGFIARLLLWATMVLLILDNLGFDITTLVAGLGIGGIAVALAAQNILGDLFASLSIVLDKPFLIGDFVVVDDTLGTIEHIGMKTTRIRSLSGEEIAIANSDLLKSRIRNFKRMYERRQTFTIGVVYDTPAEKLERIPEMIRSIVQAQPRARFDRSHFKSYGDFALVFETVYFVGEPDYAVFMNIQQAINLELFRRFKAEGIEFAYPTQTVILQKPA